MLKVSNVSKYFSGRAVLKDVSFELENSQMVGIVGPSGSGKSVLLKIIGSVLEPDRGEVDFTGLCGEPSCSVGFLFQEGGLFDSLTVHENVAFPLLKGAVKRTSKSVALERAETVLKRVGLGKALAKVPGQLSGGMRRRAGIARALVGDPQVVLLDDPTGGLDPVAASVIMDLIKELHEETKPTVMIVSHDIRRLLPNVERVLALFDGELVSDVPAQELMHRADERVVKFLSMRYDFSHGDPAAQGGPQGAVPA